MSSVAECCHSIEANTEEGDDRRGDLIDRVPFQGLIRPLVCNYPHPALQGLCDLCIEVYSSSYVQYAENKTIELYYWSCTQFINTFYAKDDLVFTEIQ